jgi:endonuclease V-like protein UPF0215 family
VKRRHYSNIVAFDDAPFTPDQHDPVKIVGTVFAGLRLDGVLIGDIEKDGSDAAAAICQLIQKSRFQEHIQLVMLQGIAFGGFNVINIFEIHRQLRLPVLVLARHRPDLKAIRYALINHLTDGAFKWQLIKKAGPMEPVAKIWMQRVGLSVRQATEVVQRTAAHSHIPEPIRAAHLIAGALINGESRGDP